MLVTIVHITVKEEYIQDFIEASRKNHIASIQEDGNRRFDLIQSTDTPAQFILYEAYDTANQAAAHKETAHYTLWRETVADMMAEPRKGVPYQGLCPSFL